MLAKLEKVSKTFLKSKTKALAEVSLEIYEGEIISVVGKNGSGKSTLLRIIAGLVTPDEGKVYRKFAPKSVQGMAVHFEEINNLFGKSTPYEMVEYFAILNGIRKNRSLENEIEELFATFDLCFHKNKYVADLSKGMKQKLSLCCNLIIKPKVLLLDEPTLGLDAGSIDKLAMKLKELSKNNRTGIVTATHDKNFMDKLSAKIFSVENDRNSLKGSGHNN